MCFQVSNSESVNRVNSQCYRSCSCSCEIDLMNKCLKIRVVLARFSTMLGGAAGHFNFL